MWSFGNGFARNVVTFGVDNTSSPHTQIKNINNLVKDQLTALMIALVQQKKN